jgi:hypothetical protein
MGELNWWQKICAWIEGTGIVCFLGRRHAFKYEPMPGDEPPFELSHCAYCNKERGE